MISRKNSLVFYILSFILLGFTQSRLHAEDVVGTLVRTIDMSCFTTPNCPDPNTMNPGAIGSPDPSGIAYLNVGPRAGHLLIVDGEVNEMPWLFSNQNANTFQTTLTGELVASSSTLAFTDEPTGVAFNPENLHVFIADDNNKRIIEINPGADGVFGTSDDTVVASISTSSFNSGDPEGIAYDYIEGALYIVDGLNAEVYKVLPGLNGQFDGAPPNGDDIVSNFDTLSLGVDDPEGIEWDPVTGNLYIVGNPETRVIEVTTAGALVRTIDISAANAETPAGLTLAPWSGMGSDPDPDVLNLYIVDRGIDNSSGSDSDPFENDGKLYEISIPGEPFGSDPTGNRRPSVSAGPNQVIDFTASCSDSANTPCKLLAGIVTDDGLPDPPSQVSINWSVISGPGSVVFGNPNAAETTASFSTAGEYILRLTADDTELSNSRDVRITVLPPELPLTSVYLTTETKGTVRGLAFGREDILRYAIDTDTWSIHFDGSNAGLGTTDINGFHLMADDSILITLRKPAVLPGVGSVDSTDIVRFIPTSLGENNTTGVFELYFKGANVGLGPSLEVSAEIMNAISILPDGRLVVSTSGSFSVPGVSGADEDLIAFTATSLGETTSGTWEFYFDGSDVGLSASNDHEIEGVSVGANGDIYLSTKGNYSLPTGLSGDSTDIIRCKPLSIGPSTSCNYNVVWSGSSHGLSGYIVNGIHLAFGAAGNSAPTVTISTPVDGATLASGASITFSATASDVEDGDVAGSLAWSSSLDGALGTGGTIDASLSAGTHVITASVTDSGGLSGSQAINVTLSTTSPQNTAPTVTISTPADGATLASGASITFSATASDVEDGDVTGSLAWSSSLDGALGTGGAIDASLSAGTHVITASVSDSGGLSGSQAINVTISTAPTQNTAPTVTISTPTDGATFASGTSITFSATASDAEDEDGNLTGSLAWSSSLDGALGTGGTIDASLSAGTHVITASVTDSGGLSGSQVINVTLSTTSPQNTAPTVTISTPADGATLASGGSITFTATASDVEDGDMAGSLAWNSSLDGPLGAGGTIDASLSVGTHVITASVTDNGGLSGSQAINVTVSPSSSLPAGIYVSTNTWSGNVGGVSFGREDILHYDTNTDTWSVYFDGSNVGLRGSGLDVNAFHIMADGSILLVMEDPAVLPNVGLVDNSDIVRFIPTSLGEDNTAGVFELYFKGANVGLGPSSENGNERIDALSMLPDGRLVVSTSGSPVVPGVSGKDEDLIAFTATSLGETTSGTWEFYFDGSDVGLGESNDEDVEGVSIGDNGDIYLTTRGNFSASVISGDGVDIIRCKPLSTGSNTSCNFDLFWRGTEHGLSGHSLNGIQVIP